MMSHRLSCTVLGLLACAWPVAADEKPTRSAAPGTVTLPLVEYDRLVERAAHPPEMPEKPPVAAVLSSASLTLRVDGRAVRGTMELAGEVFRPGP